MMTKKGEIGYSSVQGWQTWHNRFSNYQTSSVYCSEVTNWTKQ